MPRHHFGAFAAMLVQVCSGLRVLAGLAALASLASLASGCAAQNLSRTVGKGNGEAHVNLGGPFADILGPTIPVAQANVGGRYGVTDWMDVDANVNAMAMVFQILGLDVATNFQLYRKPRGLAIASSARLYMYGDLDDAPRLRAFPELGLHLGGPIPKLQWLHLYGGTTATFQFEPVLSRNPNLFLVPFFGAEFLIPQRFAAGAKARQHGISLHTMWLNPWDTSNSVMGYSPGPGVIALYLGYRLRFGGLDR